MLLFATCQKELDKPVGNNKVVLSPISVDSVYYFLTKVRVQLTSDEGNTITDHGFCWAITPNPDVNSNLISLGKRENSGTFSTEIKGLDENTRYYIRAFTTFAGNTIYNEQREITTLKTGKPQITTAELSDITLISAICGGEIESDSGYAVTTSGICWDTDNQFNENQCLGKDVNTSGESEFSLNITGLTESTTYYVKAYATNQKGTGYGDVRQLIPCKIPPAVTTKNITNPGSISAMCGGNVTSDGNAKVTARGICWNITGNPALDNCINFTSDGQGTGTFTSNITNLTPSTTYYVKAYAINSAGTGYGQVEQFATIAPWPCGTSFAITHTAGSTAPVNKTVSYGTVQTNLTGSDKCWITQNLGADLQATSATDATEASVGWYWQFNKKQGYKHDGTTRTPNTTWITSINENSHWLNANDPCTLLLGSGWRIPTKTEWEMADATGGWSNYNQTYASVLKLHAVGCLLPSDGSLYGRISTGSYWSSLQSDSGSGWSLISNSFNSGMNINSKAIGGSLRCLRD